jgi:hypothetical protein
MKSTDLRKVFQPQPGVHVGLVLVRPGEPNEKSLGVLISNRRNHTDAVIAELELKDEDKNVRTRLVFLQRFMEIGASIDPRCDLLPIRQEGQPLKAQVTRQPL